MQPGDQNLMARAGCQKWVAGAFPGRPALQPAQVLDEDEFAAAIVTYGYTPDFQDACHRAVAEALELIEGWTPRKAG